MQTLDTEIGTATALVLDPDLLRDRLRWRPLVHAVHQAMVWLVVMGGPSDRVLLALLLALCAVVGKILLGIQVLAVAVLAGSYFAGLPRRLTHA